MWFLRIIGPILPLHICILREFFLMMYRTFLQGRNCSCNIVLQRSNVFHYKEIKNDYNRWA
ncbi:MAG: hypothetical protein H6Q20_525 [Bacteroidetes bacterium]|nr:hypothetical protein [Bacteroidota bacterium]